MRTARVGVLICMSLMAGGAAAQTQGGVVLKGRTEINANAENINTVAVGSGNVAKTNIGSIKSGTHENVKITVDVKNVSNVVSGRGKKGCVNIGSRGTDPDCK